MLAEVDVLNAVAAHLRSEGYRIVEQRSTAERGIDLVAVKANGAVCWVEAKGGTSSRPGSPRHGRPYDAPQVFDVVAKGFYQTMCRRVEAPAGARIAFAAPDTALFIKYLAPLRELASKLEIEILVVASTGAVRRF
jgi:hypothetical protein